ncbi:uncharacterized protein LOC129313019 isoform X1 [Prosopis cineraria]|uniref:uncharacterized protein LOC129313019 isoform X1 n=1 Tax=Prosopis cineraria TaxID=364024 RepID=UPI002410613B|nr:uncharacterized protein LOC129313019 isoform X1 [Prosopis cineraria]
MEYLFSITVSSILPKLQRLDIEEASALEHVLIREDEPKEMAMKDVLPQLMYIRLQKLPRLNSVCHGIDFQTLEESSQVDDCPNFSFHETTANHLQGTQEKLTSHLINTNPSDTGKAKGTPHSTREIVEVDVISENSKMPSLSSDSNAGIDQLGTKDQVGYAAILEDPNTKKIEKNEFEGSELGKTTPATPVVTIDELVCKDVKKEADTMDPHSVSGETEPDMKSNESRNIVEKKAEEGASLENLKPNSLNSKEAPIPTGGSTMSTTLKFFEEELEEEGGGLRTSRRHVNSSMGKEHETSIHGDPCMPPAPIVSNDQTSMSLLPLSPVSSIAPTSLQRTPSSTPSKSTLGIQDSVETSNQLPHEAMDTTIQVSSELVEHEEPATLPSFRKSNNAQD